MGISSIVLGIGYLASLITAREGRKECALYGLIWYSVITVAGLFMVKVGVPQAPFFSVMIVICSMWFVTSVYIGNLPCMVTCGALIILDLLMVIDGFAYPSTITPLYNNYENIAFGVHVIMILGIWSHGKPTRLFRGSDNISDHLVGD